MVTAWSLQDRAGSVHSADRAFVDASANVRALIVELALAGGLEEDLYDACAVLGRIMAQRGGSPTLASATIDHAAEVLGARSARWVVPARAAVVEGFTATVVENAQLEALRSWEFPRCAVSLGQAALAIAAGHPSQDEEVLGAWSARVARAASLAGARRAIVSGGALATAALLDALALVGIEANTEVPRR